MGITSARDNFVVDFEQKTLEMRIKDFCNKEIETHSFQSQYKLKENYQWKVEEQRAEVPEFSKSFIKSIYYRPFDNRWIYYQANLVFRMRGEVMQNLEKQNLSFCRESNC
jgi:predicted helicase